MRKLEKRMNKHLFNFDLAFKEHTDAIKIESCARCGKLHREVVFYAFTWNPVDDHDGPFTHFGFCPSTSEPILMRLETILSGEEGIDGR